MYMHLHSVKQQDCPYICNTPHSLEQGHDSWNIPHIRCRASKRTTMQIAQQTIRHPSAVSGQPPLQPCDNIQPWAWPTTWQQRCLDCWMQLVQTMCWNWNERGTMCREHSTRSLIRLSLSRSCWARVDRYLQYYKAALKGMVSWLAGRSPGRSTGQHGLTRGRCRDCPAERVTNHRMHSNGATGSYAAL